MSLKHKVELLAPAGNIDSLKSAITAGANAVYLGLESFNARMNADNFTRENLAEWVKYCHMFDVRVFLTLNILIKDSELIEVIDILKIAEKSCVDAVIFGDLAVIELAKKHAPSIELHASTQLGIHNLEGAKYLESLGVKRVVVSRETLLCDIQKIKQYTSLEVEHFIHGALCVSFSGNCYASSFINGGSGNRGRCLQTCRLPYSYSSMSNMYKTKTIEKVSASVDNYEKSKTNDVGEYLLSTSDLNTTEVLSDFIDVGIDSFKIEGRMRSAQYVHSAVTLYRGILDKKNPTGRDIYLAQATFNRGNFTKGYNFDAEKNLMSTKINGNFGALFGHIVKKVSESKYLVKCADFDVKNFVNKGDGVKVFKSGNEIGGGKIVDIEQGVSDTLIITLCGEFPIGSQLRVTAPNSFTLSEPKIKIDVKIQSYIDKPLTLTATIHSQNLTLADLDSDFNITAQRVNLSESSQTDDLSSAIAMEKNAPSVKLSSEFVLQASEKNGAEIIENELKKLGGSIFAVNNLDYIGDTSVFIPKSVLKALKNQLILSLEDRLVALYNSSHGAILKDACSFSSSCEKNEDNSIEDDILNVYNRQSFNDNKNLNEVIEFNAHLPQDVLDRQSIFSYFPKDITATKDNINILKDAKLSISKGKLYLRLPNIARGKDLDNIKDLIDSSKQFIDGLHIENFYGVSLAKENDLPYLCGYFMNITNSLALQYLSTSQVVLSAELSKGDMRSISKKCHNVSLYSYSVGEFPLMTLSHCPLKLNNVCDCSSCSYSGDICYKDRLTTFHIKRVKNSSCYFYLLNSAVHHVTREELGEIFPYLDCKDLSESAIIECIGSVKPKTFTKGYINKSLK